MEDPKDLQNESPQNEEIKETYEHDLDLLGSNRGRFPKTVEEPQEIFNKRGDGGDLL